LRDNHHPTINILDNTPSSVQDDHVVAERVVENNITDLSPADNEEEIGVSLAYKDEACVKIVARDRQSDHNYVGPVMDEDLSSWLGRPQLITSGALDVALGQVFNINYNSAFPLSIPIWSRKLANVLGMRADLHITLNVNASRFMLGCLGLHLCQLRLLALA